MKVNQIETPALILDLDRMESNIATMQDLARQNGIAMRPHYKSHKCPWIAQRQIEAGAKGITCAKLGEAEDLIEAGFRDVLIANQITDRAKLARLAWLAHRCRLGVCVDEEKNIADLEQAAALAGATIYCLIEYEVGMKRCGVETKEEFLRLAKKIKDCPHLTYDGIQAYAGNLAHMPGTTARESASQAVDARLEELIAYLKAQGMAPATVSGVSTGTAAFKQGGVYTEIQAGSYVFMDGAYGAMDLGFQHALFVLSEIISRKKDRFVADAGLKSFGIDQGLPQLMEHRGADTDMSEEHIRVMLPDHGYAVGDKLRFIPGHGCTTVNLYDRIYLFRGEDVIGLAEVVSRGKSR